MQPRCIRVHLCSSVFICVESCLLCHCAVLRSRAGPGSVPRRRPAGCKPHNMNDAGHILPLLASAQRFWPVAWWLPEPPDRPGEAFSRRAGSDPKRFIHATSRELGHTPHRRAGEGRIASIIEASGHAIAAALAGPAMARPGSSGVAELSMRIGGGPVGGPGPARTRTGRLAAVRRQARLRQAQRSGPAAAHGNHSSAREALSSRRQPRSLRPCR